MHSVVQYWVEDLPLMQQSVLLSAVRAPDGISKGHPAKFLWRWLRRCFLIGSFERRILATPEEEGGGSFTGPIADIDEAVRRYFYEVDSVPFHGHMHLIHAAEILGYKHPDLVTRAWWLDFYMEAANDVHMECESEEAMDYRLSDDEKKWKETEHFPAGEMPPKQV